VALASWVSGRGAGAIIERKPVLYAACGGSAEMRLDGNGDWLAFSTEFIDGRIAAQQLINA
jgi:hypothetical protein